MEPQASPKYEVLDQVKQVLDEREKNYDSPRENFTRIAGYWNILLEGKLTRPITPEEVALMMVLMKVAREQHQHKEDNLVDLIGYAAIATRLTQEEARRDAQIKALKFAWPAEFPLGVQDAVHDLAETIKQDRYNALINNAGSLE